MNIIDLARFSLMTEILVGAPSKHNEILGSFWSDDKDIVNMTNALSSAFKIDGKLASANDFLARAAHVGVDNSVCRTYDTDTGAALAFDVLGWAIAHKKQTKRHLFLGRK
jgi:hypothetical protein